LCGFICAACGSVDGNFYVSVQYSGNSSCQAQVNGLTLTAAQASCRAPLFPGRTCFTLNGPLLLSVTNEVNASAATFFQPRFDTALQALGLGSLASIDGVLRLFVYHSPYPIPVNLTPVFGRSIRDVHDLIVGEFGDGSAPPRTSRLVGLPGLVGIQRFNSINSNIIIFRTALRDMSSFAGLVQPPKSISISDNLQLSSLSGLQGLATWTSDVYEPRTSIMNNNLKGASSVSALAKLAGCPTTSLDGSSFVQIEVIGCSIFAVSSSTSFEVLNPHFLRPTPCTSFCRPDTLALHVDPCHCFQNPETPTHSQ
jgi:hypothetical protein